MRLLWISCVCLILCSCNKKVTDTVSKDKAENLSTTNEKVVKETKTVKPTNEPLQTRPPLTEAKSQRSEKTISENQLNGASSSYKVYYQSGQDKHNAGDFNGAVKDFTKAIELHPQFADGYGFRGLSKFKSGNKEGACSDWQKAKELGYQHGENLINNYCK